jgi:hypothetical protein
MILTTAIVAQESMSELQVKIEKRNGYKFESPTHDRFTGLLSRIHEIGHHALFPEWGIEWALAIRQHHQSRGLVRSIAPWIPSLELPFEVLPDEQVVKLWTAHKAIELCLEPTLNLSKAAVLNDHAANETANPDLLQLPRFGKTPQQYLLDWCDGLEMKTDDFSLPNPIATDVDGIIENWHAIASFYSDRCPVGTAEWIQNLPDAWHQLLKAQFNY